MKLLAKLERSRVKLLCNQRSATQPQKMTLTIAARRKSSVVRRIQQERSHAGLIERGCKNTAVSGGAALRQVHEATVGKRLRPTVRGFAARHVEGGQGRGRSAGCGDLEDARGYASKKDAAVTGPCSATARKSVADY